jgi:hypothetical protein
LSRTLVLISLLLLAGVATVSAVAKSDGAPYQTGHDSWRTFAGWTGPGTVVASDGSLTLATSGLAAGTDAPGAYYGGDYYNGGSYLVGEATSPVTTTAFGFTEAIASWNAATPAGTWVETWIQARIADRWTKWYSLGVWASGETHVRRHSVRLQGDTDGFVAVDTLVLNGKKAPPANAYRMRLQLFTTSAAVSPSVGFLSVATSTAAPDPRTVEPSSGVGWNTLLKVPEHSQMVYPDGGNVWCSPTSVSMVLSYWNGNQGTIESRVRSTVVGVYDWIYDGHGNWPFNTAFAATEGMEASVARFTSMNDVETWVAAGIPVVFSWAWKKGEVTGSAVSSSDGHLAVIVGFDGAGNPIVNDPAALSNGDVQRPYDRAELETVWLRASGGTVYLIYPKGRTGLPAL